MPFLPMVSKGDTLVGEALLRLWQLLFGTKLNLTSLSRVLVPLSLSCVHLTHSKAWRRAALSQCVTNLSLSKHVHILKDAVPVPYVLPFFLFFQVCEMGLTPASHQGVSSVCGFLLAPWYSQLLIKPTGSRGKNSSPSSPPTNP